MNEWIWCGSSGDGVAVLDFYQRHILDCFPFEAGGDIVLLIFILPELLFILGDAGIFWKICWFLWLMHLGGAWSLDNQMDGLSFILQEIVVIDHTSNCT